MTVAHDAVAASVIAQVLEALKDLGYFEFERALEDLSRTLTDEVVERRQWTDGLLTFGHGGRTPSGL